MKIPDRLARKALILEKHAPQLLFVGGVIGAVGSTVIACRSTLKLHEVLDTAQHELELSRTMENPDYSEEDRQKDTAVIYLKSAVAVGKLYAPAVVLGGASIGMLAKSHNILQRRNAALTAAYVALERGFEAYRERVIDKYGEDQDREFRFPREKVKEENPATGREHTVEVVSPIEGYSIYARFFDPSCSSWNDDPEINSLFLKSQQAYANVRLRSKGHIFLNEVYDMLGIDRSPEGSIVGWLWNTDQGDEWVDFGIFNGDSEATRSFVNGREGSILLDFNVDGPIWDKI